jgi:hypothetical protein
MVTDVFTPTPQATQYRSHNAILRGKDQMKYTTISRICCLTIICFVGFSPIAYLRAQQAVTVTPEVKADALRRLDLSRSAQIPQSMVNKDGLWLRICNKGAKPSDPGNQEYACSRFVGESRPRSLDDLLPAFKYCAISNDCSISIAAIARSGHPDYALALAEYAPNCKGCGVLGEVITESATGTIRGTLYLGQLSVNGTLDNDPQLATFNKVVDPTGHIEIGNSDDVRRLLERGCTEAGRQSACRLYQAAGGRSDDRARSQAEIARKSEEGAVIQARRNQESSSNQTEAASQQRWSNVTAALQSASSTTPSIQDTAAQQQANLQATAAAIQQRQQAETQTRLAAVQNAETKQTTPSSVRTAPSNTNTSSSSTTATSAATPNTNNPYSSTPAQGSYNPYTGTGSGSAQGSCTDMTGSVQGTVKVGSDGWVSGYLTNNSNQALFVSYTFKQNGVPSTAMANSGGTTIQGGQTVGGEGQGLYSTGADKNPPEIYWYAVLKSEHDKYGCAHKW